jgi:putative DNA primase/helicase
VPPEKRDPAVKATLKDPEASGPAILAWLIQGCLDWQRDGLGVPDCVTAATEEYRASEDTFAQFLDDRCVIADGVSAPAAGLYEDYADWCGRNGEEPMSQTAFGRRLTDRGFKADRDPISRRKIRLGIGRRAEA